MESSRKFSGLKNSKKGSISHTSVELQQTAKSTRQRIKRTKLSTRTLFWRTLMVSVTTSMMQGCQSVFDLTLKAKTWLTPKDAQIALLKRLTN